MSAAPQDIWAAPSPRLVSVRRVQLGLVTLVLLVAGVLAGTTAGALPAVVVGAAVLVAAGLAEGALRRRARSWRYAERADDLLVSRGVLVRRSTVVPYGRMQHVDVTAGVFDRAFGLATVQLHTAAVDTHARIPGLPAAEATRLRDVLAALGEARAAGL